MSNNPFKCTLFITKSSAYDIFGSSVVTVTVRTYKALVLFIYMYMCGSGNHSQSMS